MSTLSVSSVSRPKWTTMAQRIVKSLIGMRTFAAGIACAALLTGAPARAASPSIAPTALYVTAGGRTVSTAQLKGHRTLLWLLSTWCGSCAAGLQALTSESGVLAKAGMQVVVLRNYRNGGYPGQNILSFVQRFAPALLNERNWTFGQASQAFARAYNRQDYPDIYFLIDASGRIQAVDSAPGATMNRILRFARGAAR